MVGSSVRRRRGRERIRKLEPAPCIFDLTRKTIVWGSIIVMAISISVVM